MTDVPSTHNWRTNADMIADVAKLGYLDGTVFDATFGEGNFWIKFEPSCLITNDLYKDADHHVDYTELAVKLGNDQYDSVVFDPDYKMTGTPSSPAMDFAYGTDKPMRYQDRLANIDLGARQCYTLCRRYLLVKCMDQVVSGNVVWQTDLITRTVESLGGRKVDRFDFVTDPRPQPEGRRQVHARRNSSTLLVFEKGKAMSYPNPTNEAAQYQYERSEAAESALRVARDELDELRHEYEGAGQEQYDQAIARAETAEASLRVARDALREIMVTARDLTAGRSDDAVLVEVADIAASALLAQEVSPNG
jgi:uncharacterized protein YukE